MTYLTVHRLKSISNSSFQSFVASLHATRVILGKFDVIGSKCSTADGVVDPIHITDSQH